MTDRRALVLCVLYVQLVGVALLVLLVAAGCGTKAGYYLACGQNPTQWPEDYCEDGPPR